MGAARRRLSEEACFVKNSQWLGKE
jgi:hypothetical protein